MTQKSINFWTCWVSIEKDAVCAPLPFAAISFAHHSPWLTSRLLESSLTAIVFSILAFVCFYFVQWASAPWHTLQMQVRYCITASRLPLRPPFLAFCRSSQETLWQKCRAYRRQRRYGKSALLSISFIGRSILQKRRCLGCGSAACSRLARTENRQRYLCILGSKGLADRARC